MPKLPEPSMGITSVVQNETASREKLRYSYKPKRIRFLVIAESPPASGGFFYNDKTIGRDYLFAETVRALRFWPERGELRRGFDKRRLLRQLQRKGVFLIDSSLTPIDKLADDERDRRVRDGIPRIVQDIRRLRPQKIVLVKKNVFRLVMPELVRKGFSGRILNKELLPFPSYGNQQRYRDGLRRLLRS